MEKQTKKMKTEKQVKEKKYSKNKKVEIQPKIVERKVVKASKHEKALIEKKSRLAVAGRQTKWAPVWVIVRRFGAGKRIHPSAVTAVRRSWRRTKLDIGPRKIRKWHMG